MSNTIFILTADHGEILGEHNLFTHDMGLYNEEIKIPFIIFGPNVKGRRVLDLYSLRNVPAIVRALAEGSIDKIGLQGERYVVQRHYVSDALQKIFLPVFCQVDLLRITFPRYSVFYYRHDNRD